MTLKSLAGLALIVLGAVALAWPTLSYTKAAHEARVGPLAFTVKERGTIHVPVWAGLTALAAGTVVLWRRKG